MSYFNHVSSLAPCGPDMYKDLNFTFKSDHFWVNCKRREGQQMNSFKNGLYFSDNFLSEIPRKVNLGS